MSRGNGLLFATGSRADVTEMSTETTRRFGVNFTLLIPDQQTQIYVGTVKVTDDTALYNEIQSLIQGKNAIVIGDFNCANVD